jgi:hypothetical protein
MAGKVGRERRRQCLTVFALSLAAVGQYLLTVDNRDGGLALFAVAVPMLVIALRGWSSETPSRREPDARGQWNGARFGLALTAVGCNVAALRFLWEDDTSHLGVLLWLVSLGFVTLAAPVSGVIRGPGRMSTLARCAEIALSALVLLLAAFLRIYRIHDLPPGVFIDETNAAIDALRILDGEPISPFVTGWFETPTLYAYYMAGLFRLAGVSFFALKLASILPGLLTVASVYPLAVRLSPSTLRRS